MTGDTATAETQATRKPTAEQLEHVCNIVQEAAMTGLDQANADFNQVQQIAIRGDELKAVIVKKVIELAQAQVPADGVWFDLMVDNNVKPLEVVRTAGFDNWGDWKYIGPALTGKKTQRVKLVHLGYCKDIDDARAKAKAQRCELVEGQARDEFRRRFSKYDGNGPVIFGGSEWRGPDGRPGVACLHDVGGEWDSHFYWSGGDFNGRCRWLVRELPSA